MKNDIVLGDGTRQTEKNKTVPNGIWPEFAEEEMFNNMDDEDESPAFPSYYDLPEDVDTALDLEADAKEGR